MSNVADDGKVKGSAMQPGIGIAPRYASSLTAPAAYLGSRLRPPTTEAASNNSVVFEIASVCSPPRYFTARRIILLTAFSRKSPLARRQADLQPRVH